MHTPHGTNDGWEEKGISLTEYILHHVGNVLGY